MNEFKWIVIWVQGQPPDLTRMDPPTSLKLGKKPYKGLPLEGPHRKGT